MQQSGPVGPQNVPEGQSSSLSQPEHVVALTSPHMVPWLNVK
jgi:hypothetical protein